MRKARRSQWCQHMQMARARWPAKFKHEALAWLKWWAGVALLDFQSECLLHCSNCSPCKLYTTATHHEGERPANISITPLNVHRHARR